MSVRHQTEDRVDAAPSAPGSGSNDSIEPSEKAGGTNQLGPTTSPVATPNLEGTWQAGPLSLKEIEATIRRYGLGRYVEDYRENSPFFGDDTVLTLTIENGAWDLYGQSGAGSRCRSIIHHSDGSNFYRWQVDVDTPFRQVDAARLPGDPGRGVPAGPLHDRNVHEAGLTGRSTASTGTDHSTRRQGAWFEDVNYSFGYNFAVITIAERDWRQTPARLRRNDAGLKLFRRA